MTEMEPRQDIESEVIDVPSLFDEYNLQMVNLGGGPVLLNPEGQGVFAGHLRMQKAQQLAGIFGDLICQRIEDGPIEEGVVVADFDLSGMDGYDMPYIVGQAVWRTPSYLGLEGVDFFELEKHKIIDNNGDEIKVSEVEMPNGTFVSTHHGSQKCKILLTPSSVLVQ